MRLATLATLALLPVLAHAQASSPAATLQARSESPALLRAAAETAPAAAPAANVSLAPAFHYRDMVSAKLTTPVLDEAQAQGGTLSYTLAMDGKDLHLAGPQLTHVVGRTLPLSVLAETESPVAISLTVTPQGVPTNLVVERSGGAVLDKSTLEAVSQYRFKPATYNNMPVATHVLLTLTLQK